ncbi:type II toxin-antitoxin system RelE/ParE family toxin [Pseudoduganella aquatica]|uniref:Type II toxin-antitoxin system RelE/ParE family toxin n=1 Tax=Pseudoduganella aquatica TaxID=2660641 RepID=A0A7X4H9L9_9BURK|nr:type II toxin-antitoxin system RelE/ParE family toxin [Pseudoduganella aquatica]MYN07191.1 type II toxin-antitoxin system RelE/ParE family toxin [Pseudoduganella aquatica]
MKRVLRSRSYQEDLDDIERYIARSNPRAAVDLWLRIDEQVDKLADPNFPRRPGRVAGTFELVAHKNYIVVFYEDVSSVYALNVIHARKRYP